jgi:hypothetical protein
MTDNKNLFEIAKKYNLDKLVMHTYIDVYNTLFKDFDIENMLEIGIGIGTHESEMQINFNYIGGNSLLFWKESFPNALIHGIDILNTDRFILDDRIYTYICDQNSKKQLKELVNATGDYDLVIDDGSHQYEHQKTSLETLIYHIKPNGFYIIEDVFDNHYEKLYNLVDIDSTTKEYIINNFEIFSYEDKEICTEYRTHHIKDLKQYMIVFKHKNNQG